jgi:hypothetical protein
MIRNWRWRGGHSATLKRFDELARQFLSGERAAPGLPDGGFHYAGGIRALLRSSA